MALFEGYERRIDKINEFLKASVSPPSKKQKKSAMTKESMYIIW